MICAVLGFDVLFYLKTGDHPVLHPCNCRPVQNFALPSEELNCAMLGLFQFSSLE